MDIERILVRMLADASQYNRVMNETENRLMAFVRNTTGIGNALNVPVIGAVASVGALGAAFVSASYNAIQLAASYEKTTVALRNMIGDTEKAKKLVDDITQLAIETPFKSPELLSGARQLRAFGTEAEHILPTLRVLGEVTSAVDQGTSVGLGEHSLLNRIILAFGQIKVAGRLMGPELRQLIDAGVPMMEYLAKAMGKPIPMIRNLVHEGRVGFPEVIRAFNLMVAEGGRFSGALDAQSKTISGRWSAAIETMQVKLRALGLAFFEGFGVNDLLVQWRESMDAMSDTGGATEFFRNMRMGLEQVVQWLRFLGHGIADAVTWIRSLFQDLRTWANENQKLVASLVMIIGLATSLRLAIHAVVVVIRLLAAAFAILRTVFAFNAITMVVIGFFTSLVGLVTFLISPLGVLIVLLGNLAFILSDLTDTSATDWLNQLGGSFLEGLNKIAAIGKDAFGGIMDAVSAGEFELAFQIAFKTVEYAFKQMLASLRAEWTKFIGGIIPSSAGVSKDFGGFVDLQMLNLEEWLRVNNPLNDEATKTQIRQAAEQQRKAILQGHAQAVVKAQEKMSADVARIMAENDPLAQQIRELTQEAARRRRESDWTKMAKQNAPEIAKLEASYSNLVMEAFARDMANQGPVAAVGRWFGPGGLIENGQFIRGASHLVSPAEAPGGLRFPNGGGFPTAEQVQASQAAAIQRRLIELDPRRQNMLGAGVNVMAMLQGYAASGRFPGQIPEPLGLRPETLDYAMRLQRDITAGNMDMTDKFARFQQRMGFLVEGRAGLFSSTPGGLFGGIGSVLSEEDYKLGMMKEYGDLRDFVGKRRDILPAAMFRGTAEAQDAVNQAQLQNRDIQEEIADTLKTAAEYARENRDYMARVTAALEEMRAKGIIVGGF